MTRQMHALVQGSQEWRAHRSNYFNASDAPAMMGCSQYKTRSQLFHEMHTGLSPEIDAGLQRRFDDGHRFEALARPIAEKIVGQELFAVTMTDGKLSASFDGLTMCETIAFEHKSLNAELRALDCLGSELPMQYRVQMEHQCMVSGSSRVLFMASKWDGDTLVEVRHCWYTPDADLRAAIGAGWNQFEQDLADIDLATYIPPASAAPTPTGRAPETLPALLITVRGEVTDSNLADFKAVALAAIRSVNRELKNDQDFADAEKAVKWCSDIEDRVAGAKQHALSQTATIDSLFKTMDDISAEARQVRLDLDKLVKARKVSVRSEIVERAGKQVRDHQSALCARLGESWLHILPYYPALLLAIKGKKTVASLNDAVDGVVADCKIEMNDRADKMQVNLNLLREHKEHAFLFPDGFKIVTKEADDFAALVKSRIADHKAAELAKEEQTRARILKEVQDKLAREDEAKRRDEENAAATAAMQGIEEARREGYLPAPMLDILEGVATDLIADLAVSRAATTSANVVPMRAAMNKDDPDADGLWISPKLMREFYKLHVCSQHEQLQKELTSLFADHFGRIQSNSRHPDQKEQS